MRRLCLLLGALFVPMFSLFAQQLPPPSPSSNTGTIEISGVDTLITLTQNIASLYTLDGFAGAINVRTASNADAFVGLCAGTVDVVLSARLITSDEQNACLGNAFTPIEFRVATDALILVTSPQNSFLTDINTPELQLAFSTALNWSDIRASFPSVPINRYTPDANSGDFAFFVNAVFGGDSSRLLSAIGLRQNADATAQIQAIASDANGIAFVSASIFNRNSSQVRAIPLDGSSADTNSVVAGTYSLTRPLALYVAKETLQDKAQVADFVNYYLTNVNNEVTPLGLYPTSQTNYSQAVANWFNATGAQAEPTPAVAFPTETPAVGATDVVAETATPVPTTVTQNPSEDNALLLLIDERADLELLANNALGGGRPAGWSGSLDTNNPQLALLIRLDLETLATATVGETVRPTDWFGAVSSTSYAIARDIRHDLELLADELLGFNQRPDGWKGADPLLRCDRATQALANLLSRGGVFQVNIDRNAPDYCRQVEKVASVFSEVNLLSNPIGQPVFSQQTQAQVQGSVAGSVKVDTEFAVAFLDRNAALKLGVIPFGTSVRPIARSYVQFSNMLLVEGADFLVFVDYTDTTLDESQFKALPDVDNAGGETFCAAEFCGE